MDNPAFIKHLQTKQTDVMITAGLNEVPVSVNLFLLV